MARYFFHIDGTRPYHDEIGEELRDNTAAWRVATRLCRDIEDFLKPGQSWKLRVTTEGRIVFSIVILTEAVERD